MRTFIFPFLVCSLFLVIELVCAGPHSRAEAQPVHISASHDSLRAGQVFDIYIVFEGSQAFDRVIFPDSTQFSDPFEFRNAAFGITPQEADSARISLQFFGDEDTELEDLFVVGIQQTDTLAFELPPLLFHFRATLAEDDELRPLKPIFEFAASLLPWIIAALLIAVAGGGFWYWYRYIRKPEPPPLVEEPYKIPEFINPYKELKQSIDALRSEHQKGELGTEAFYVRYSDALRGYYERLYTFPALEQTTREVVQALKARRINPSHVELTEALLSESDMVKFARYEPGPERITEVLDQLDTAASQLETHDRRLVEQMRLAHHRKYAPRESETNTPSSS